MVSKIAAAFGVHVSDLRFAVFDEFNLESPYNSLLEHGLCHT